MRIITELKQVGKSEKYKLFLNDEYVCDLSLETIYKNALREGVEVGNQQLEEMKFESDKFFALTAGTNLISKSVKTKKQLMESLAKKGFNKEVQAYVADKLEGYGYINDLQFAINFVESAKKTNGKLVIKQKLFQKGVSAENIEKALEGLQQEDEACKLAFKFMKNKEKSQEAKQKLYRYLLSKGFDYSEISSAVSKIFKGDDDDWNWHFGKWKNWKTTSNSCFLEQGFAWKRARICEAIHKPHRTLCRHFLCERSC